MKAHIQKYIESKKLAWAPSTLRSEEARLSAVAAVLNGDPGQLWQHLEDKGIKPYARVSTWIRVVSFWDFLGHTTNPYKEFKEKNARLFKHTYVPKKPEMTYEEARKLVDSIQDQSIRRRALEILGSGARWFESASHSGGNVSGKGSKNRALYVPSVEGPAFRGSYQTFRRALESLGLKPHDLRKLFLTKLVELGANEFELMEAAGWSSMTPARSYINVNKDRLQAKIRMMQEA